MNARRPGQRNLEKRKLADRTLIMKGWLIKKLSLSPNKKKVS
jgi:hypothetical protein